MAHRPEYAPQSPRSVQASGVVVFVDAPDGDRLVFKTIVQPRRHGSMPPPGLLMLLPGVHLDDPLSLLVGRTRVRRVLMAPVLRAACSCWSPKASRRAGAVLVVGKRRSRRGPGVLLLLAGRALSRLAALLLAVGDVRICFSCPRCSRLRAKD